MRSSEIRSLFLDFFRRKGHLVLPSFSLIPKDDPTLLLIGAGMAPLKPYFTGESKPPHPRVATCQKCVRTPDIERVGYTGRHAIFFEMLGNFSFGDYFKEEAITWAWELVREGFRMPREKLWISVYEEDQEAYRIWREKIGVPDERIVRLGKESNFWEIGTGPCGPCSEIYFDLGPEIGCSREDCAPGCDCDRYLEIWNLVFTEFYREADGGLTPLKQKNIDTGAGLERLAMALQGAASLYEIDLVRPLYEYFSAKVAPGHREEAPLRIVAEHSRGTVFLIADGVLPSNEGRGYVLRRLLRRAIRFGRLLGMGDYFLSQAVPLVVDLMGDAYPELRQRQDYIIQIIKTEESRFYETISQGMAILEGYLEELRVRESKVLPGEWAFKLYDTYGFPLDLTREIVAEKGFAVDEESFKRHLSGQQDRARAARAQLELGDKKRYAPAGKEPTVFDGYNTLEGEGRIKLLLVDGQRKKEAAAGDKVEVILDRTPFYAEAGGQVGDAGILSTAGGLIVVERTSSTPGGQIIHRGTVEKGKITEKDTVRARVDAERRQAVSRSHTATHLLHKTLRDLLGEHVNQAGSLVAPDRLRFDFTHFAPLSPGELKELEERMNRLILANIPVAVEYTSLEEAQKRGATALFAEKYDREAVRVVSIGEYSMELCGGTHLRSTAEIGLFKVIAEEGIGSGVRRIEAATGMESYQLIREEGRRLEKVAGMLQVPAAKLERKLEELLQENRQLQKSCQEMKQQLSLLEVGELAKKAVNVDGVKVLSAAVSAAGAEELRLMADELKKRLAPAVVVLGTVQGGKVLLVGAVTPDLVKRGYDARPVISALARLVEGGGGGRPEMAQAGGKNPAALEAALGSVEKLVREGKAVSKEHN